MNEGLKFSSEDETSINYSKYGLKSNPFPLGGQASRISPYVEISEKVSTKVVEFVNSVTASREWQGLVITGDIGTGKTRLLYSIESNINSQLKYANAIYVNKPSVTPVDFFKKVISSCNFDELTNTIVHYGDNYSNLMKIINKNLSIRTDLSQNKYYNLKDEKGLVKEIESFFKDKININDDLRKGYSILIINKMFSEIIDLENVEYEFDDFWIEDMGDVREYLSGGGTTSKKMKLLGLSDYNISESIMEKIVFPCFLQFNNIGGKSLVYALIDEFQFVVDSPSKQKIISVLNMIVAVSQTNLKGLCMILSCKPESWYVASKLSDSFQDRFKNEISMPNLNKKTGLMLIFEYLNSGRLVQIEKKEKESDTALYPFQTDAVNKILELSKYKVRDFLIDSGQILGKAVKENQETIDIQFVNQYYRSQMKQATIELFADSK
jgi:hypothetical protein